jgi:hypothetical protein
MKSLVNRRFVIAVLTVPCLMTVLFTVAPIWSGTPLPGEYDAWLDWNDDGKINMMDISRVAAAFGTNGQNISKASIEYDSGWIDITDKCGQYFNITHDLNSMDVMLDITGKATLDGGVHQRNLGLSAYVSGWEHDYGGSNIEYGNSVVKTKDGGYIVFGSTESFGAGDRDYFLVKTDRSGSIQWNATYGRTSVDQGNCAIQTSDGGYAMVGISYSFGGAWLIKTDVYGIPVWNKTYVGSYGWSTAISLIQCSDGGYALAGCTTEASLSSNDAWLVKTDANGNVQWNRAYDGGLSDDLAYSVVQTNDGGYLIAGYTRPFGGGSADAYLVKTDAVGNPEWSKTYGGLDWDEAAMIIKTSDGGYAFCGQYYSSSNYQDFWLVKIDSMGNAQWNETYATEASDFAYCVISTSDGGYAITGSFGGTLAIVKTDSGGNQQWNQTYPDCEAYYSNAIEDYGGYVLACMSLRSIPDTFDMAIVKTDTEFGIGWTGSDVDRITLYRGATDPYWNFVRVRIWKPR